MEHTCMEITESQPSIKTNLCSIWLHNDKYHREDDLPAMIYANGNKYWYQNGELHRENDQPAIVYADGDQYWYQNGELHRENDQPAIILMNGSFQELGQSDDDEDLETRWQEHNFLSGSDTIRVPSGSRLWYQHGQLHRDNDQPAYIGGDGTQEWYQHGKLHRENPDDQPAKITARGTQIWYRNGKIHREHDLPAEIWRNGTQFWYKDGEFHRDGNLPAYIDETGHKMWFIEGMRHCENGPAVLPPNGEDDPSWYIRGVRLNDTQVKDRMNRRNLVLYFSLMYNIPKDMKLLICSYVEPNFR